MFAENLPAAEQILTFKQTTTMRFKVNKEIFTKLKRHFGRLKTAGQSSAEQALIDKKISLAISIWVDEHGYCTDDCSLEHLAEAAGVSPEQLSYHFKTVIRKRFPTWRKELRIRYAQILFRKYPEMSIKEIREKVGIRDKRDFNREFKQSTGLSPGEWRECYLER